MTLGVKIIRQSTDAERLGQIQILSSYNIAGKTRYHVDIYISQCHLLQILCSKTGVTLYKFGVTLWGQLVMIIITVCCHLVQINELVVVCLHHELRLLTELGHPEVAHDGLVTGVDTRTNIYSSMARNFLSKVIMLSK